VRCSYFSARARHGRSSAGAVVGSHAACYVRRCSTTRASLGAVATVACAGPRCARLRRQSAPPAASLRATAGAAWRNACGARCTCFSARDRRPVPPELAVRGARPSHAATGCTGGQFARAVPIAAILVTPTDERTPVPAGRASPPPRVTAARALQGGVVLRFAVGCRAFRGGPVSAASPRGVSAATCGASGAAPAPRRGVS
jgi:hypothetical protein